MSLFFFLILTKHKQQRIEICARTIVFRLYIQDMEKALEVVIKSSTYFENEEKLYSCLSPPSSTMIRNEPAEGQILTICD